MTGTRFFSTHPLASVAMPTSVNFIPTPTGRESKDGTYYLGLLGREGPRIHRRGSPSPVLSLPAETLPLCPSAAADSIPDMPLAYGATVGKAGFEDSQPKHAPRDAGCGMLSSACLAHHPLCWRRGPGPGPGPGGLSPETLCCGPRSIPCSSLGREALV